jgi:hypothetical protein
MSLPGRLPKFVVDGHKWPHRRLGRLECMARKGESNRPVTGGETGNEEFLQSQRFRSPTRDGIDVRPERLW